MLATSLRGYADMRASLASAFVSEFAQRLNQLRPGNIPQQFHRAKTSSRTKCNRMIVGAAMPSS